MGVQAAMLGVYTDLGQFCTKIFGLTFCTNQQPLSLKTTDYILPFMLAPLLHPPTPQPRHQRLFFPAHMSADNHSQQCLTFICTSQPLHIKQQSHTNASTVQSL
jgi:hypothetical protein